MIKLPPGAPRRAGFGRSSHRSPRRRWALLKPSDFLNERHEALPELNLTEFKVTQLGDRRLTRFSAEPHDLDVGGSGP
jgi:hypothetical protein